MYIYVYIYIYRVNPRTCSPCVCANPDPCGPGRLTVACAAVSFGVNPSYARSDSRPTHTHYVCMYVYLHACMYVCMHLFTCVWMHIRRSGLILL